MATPAQTTAFTWLHLSDIHFGHGAASHRADQHLVLAALASDIKRTCDRIVGPVDAIIVSGDVAYSGASDQYEKACAWIDAVVESLGLSKQDVYIVPGNHDVDRKAGYELVKPAIEAARRGDSLDDLLDVPETCGALTARMQNYLQFVAQYAPVCVDSSTHRPSTWTAIPTKIRCGLKLRLVGWNTALVSDKGDQPHDLQLGKRQLVDSGERLDDEVVIAVAHHPWSWLRDAEAASAWLHRGTTVYLCGHEHDAAAQWMCGGECAPIACVTAGAAHKGAGEQAAQHSYSFGSLVVNLDGELRLRVWPRAWVDRCLGFRVDVRNVPDNAVFAERTMDIRVDGYREHVVKEYASLLERGLGVRSTGRLREDLTELCRNYLRFGNQNEEFLRLLATSNVAINKTMGEAQAPLIEQLRRFYHEHEEQWGPEVPKDNVDREMVLSRYLFGPIYAMKGWNMIGVDDGEMPIEQHVSLVMNGICKKAGP